MLSKQSSFGTWSLSLLAQWTIASLIGWAAGLAGGVLLTLVATKLPGLDVDEDRFVVYAILFSVGLATGIAQWRVMTRYLPKPIHWIWATLSGYLLGLIVLASANWIRLLSMSTTGLWDDALLLGLLGTAIGTPQWWLLRRHYHNAGVWVLASAIGFLSFGWLISHPAHSLGELVMLGAILGTMVAAVPGVTIVWLVRQPLAAGV